MIQLTPQMRILVAVEPCDFRKGIDGISQLCRNAFEENPFLCVALKYVAASHKHTDKLLAAWRSGCGDRHIRSTDFLADSGPRPWGKSVAQRRH